MTDTATPGPLAPPPRRSGPGCLWGCLFAGLIAITALIPFNYLNARLEEARHEIQESASELEIMLDRSKAEALP